MPSQRQQQRGEQGKEEGFRRSSNLSQRAMFIEELFKVIKESNVYKNEYSEIVVIIFDNEPSYSQTEVLVPVHDDLGLRRLGPYRLMCNPIENGFRSVTAHIMQYLSLMRGMNQPRTQLTSTGPWISEAEAHV
ncbi:hypothetical protein PF010_g1414 [Phytophthora fragariae]|uniref:Tc1-like transposase DDE domain-containing protein n=2 Tax=Phytophthora fragariae TaxID=53985 RepID=A0A6A3FJN6_9STRA|nr:hypothetical protein PF009_g4978 [Phytophthora fragariae]KAE9137157.1 hypothetical protein PF010_g1414 [Phytophthora fragariae]KAE9154566.1 hypothetical protein PF006_g1407 [Phytophthora fragariae]